MSSFSLRSKAATIRVSGMRGPAGSPGRVLALQASEDIAAHAFVNIYDASGDSRVRLADATDAAKFANGFAETAIASGDTGDIAGFGLNADTSVAETAGEVWLSETVPGSYQTSAPTTSGYIVQALGPAVAGQGVFFTPQSRVLL